MAEKTEEEEEKKSHHAKHPDTCSHLPGLVAVCNLKQCEKGHDLVPFSAECCRTLLDDSMRKAEELGHSCQTVLGRAEKELGDFCVSTKSWLDSMDVRRRDYILRLQSVGEQIDSVTKDVFNQAAYMDIDPKRLDRGAVEGFGVRLAEIGAALEGTKRQVNFFLERNSANEDAFRWKVEDAAAEATKRVCEELRRLEDKAGITFLKECREISQSSAVYAIFLAETEVLRDENKGLRDERRQLVQEIEKEIDTLNARVVERIRLEDRCARMERSARACEELEKKQKELERQTAVDEERFVEARKRLDEGRARVEETERRLNKGEKAELEMEERMDKMEARLAKQKEKCRDAKNELRETLLAGNKALRSDTDEEMLREKLQKAKNELVDESRMLVECRKRFGEEDAKLAAVLSENSKKARELDGQLVAKRDKLKDLEESLKKLGNEVDITTKEEREVRDKLADEQAKYNKAKKEIRKANGEIKWKQNEYKALADEIAADMKNIIHEFQDCKKEYKGKLDEFKKKYDDLKAKCPSLPTVQPAVILSFTSGSGTTTVTAEAPAGEIFKTVKEILGASPTAETRLKCVYLDNVCPSAEALRKTLIEVLASGNAECVHVSSEWMDQNVLKALAGVEPGLKHPITLTLDKGLSETLRRVVKDFNQTRKDVKVVFASA